MIKYRSDVDGLRAVAVLMVVIYHFKNDVFFHGYMGVDVFFVISGFLITKIIFKDIQLDTYTIHGFYERRVRRIFPALITVLLVSLLVAFLILLPKDLSDFVNSLVASLLFFSNIHFYLELDYFDSDANFKPLLHTWSLAVEEQFYIVFPILLWSMRKMNPLKIRLVLFALFLVSLIAYVVVSIYFSKDLAFYMFPLRSWELLAGSLVALSIFKLKDASISKANLLSLAGLALLAFGLVFDPGDSAYLVFPLFTVVVGTALIIYAGQQDERVIVSKALSIKPMLFFGKISYSLYLWHWPVFVFGNYWLLGEMYKLEKAFLIMLSILMAYLSWRFVEQPARNRSIPLLKINVMRFGMLALVFVTVASGLLFFSKGYHFLHNPELLEQAKAEFPSNEKEDYLKLESFNDNKDDFIFGAGNQLDQADIIILGDSHAQAIAPAIEPFVEKHNFTAALLRNQCILLPEFKHESMSRSKKSCLDDFEKTVAYVEKNQNVKLVILAQRWEARVKPLLNNLSAEKVADLYSRGINRVVERLRTEERVVVILGQVPRIQRWRYEKFPDAYAARLHRGLEVDEYYSIDYQAFQRNIQIPKNIFSGLNQDEGLYLVRPADKLCNTEKNVCAVKNQDGLFYFDDDHLSIHGAKYLSPLFEKIFKAAGELENTI